MKVARRFAGREDELDRGRVIRAALVQFLQTLEAMTGAGILVAHARELRFGVADGFVTAYDRINSGFAFRMQARHASTRFDELVRESLSFELSFGVLAGGTIAFAREPFGLLRETLERGRELARD